MAGALGWLRMDSVRRDRIGRYLAYAVGEIVLIFIGITLAVSFENANERRRVAQLEQDILGAIQRNLAANVEELDGNIEADETALQFLEPLIDHFSRRLPWHDSLGVRLGNALPWSSPYFDASAYESLKQLGLHVVADESVRDALVHLYEGTYARLEGDQDRAQWAFYEAVLLPIRNQELDYVQPTPSGQRAFRVRDYGTAMNRGELLSALAEHRNYLREGLARRRAARDETDRARETVAAYLENQSPPAR